MDSRHMNALPCVSEEYNRQAGLDGEDLVNLPIRTLSNNANLDEYVNVTVDGRILTEVRTNPGGHIDQFELVTWKTNDPENPKNWSKLKKWYVTVIIALTCFVVAFNSSVITADISGVAREFEVSEEVALLSITLFVVGFGIGPMVFSPLSEIFGRRPVYVLTLLVAVVFIIPGAVAKSAATLLVARAIDGIAFSAPMTLVGGTLADMWKSEERGVPMAFFSSMPFLGPAIGPLVGGFLSEACGWRWLYWIQLILSSAIWLLITLTVPETYAPSLLAKRAARLRKETGQDSHVTEQDLEKRPLAQRMSLFLLRPFQLLFLEPIVLFMSLYMSVLYGLLYMFFIAFPIVYQEGKGYSAGKTGLMFIPVAVGVVCSALLSPLINKHYLKMCALHDGKPPPKVRLIPMMVSCWFIPLGLFIFAWSSYEDLSWAGPAIGGGFPVGFGFIFLYNSANNFLVDTYQHQAASALASKTFARSLWGASTVLFTAQMYHRLGMQWASSLLAFISLACCAIPFVFYYQGASIRKHSKYAYSGDDEENLGHTNKKAIHSSSSSQQDGMGDGRNR